MEPDAYRDMAQLRQQCDERLFREITQKATLLCTPQRGERYKAGLKKNRETGSNLILFAIVKLGGIFFSTHNYALKNARDKQNI